MGKDETTLTGCQTPAMVHHTQLPDCCDGNPLAVEWSCYRAQVSRLLAEGHERKWALIKREALVAILADEHAALLEGHARFPGQDFLVHQIRASEPILRIRGYSLPCPVSVTRLAKPA